MSDSHPTLDRALDLPALTAKKSHLLLGPRQTGKTFWIRRSLPEARYFDLLDTRLFVEWSHDPGRLGEQLEARDRLVVIDEIQRLPPLLEEVQRLIETRRVRFLLTGSSARKLRRGGVNLLGGRARTRYMHPLTAHELGNRFDLVRALNRGGIPSIYFSDDARADLAAYAGDYLQQEIVAEAATRNVPAFGRFLRVAALCNGQIVNFTNVANDAQVPRTTVYEYFSILEDTLLGQALPAWRSGKQRKPIVSSKWYFFDVGVAGWLQGRTVVPETPEFGMAFEAWVFHELTTYRDYRSTVAIEFWRSTSGFEVDFLLDGRIAIEVKAKKTISRDDLKSLHAIADETKIEKRLLVCLEARRRVVDGIIVLPFAEFVELLWSGELID